MHAAVPPDMQGHTIWQTIANTIDDPDFDALPHRRRSASRLRDESHPEKSTIIQRLVNGHAGNPPIPIVWVFWQPSETSKKAMGDADVSGDRRALPAVQVDGFQVQESGLVKDLVKVDIPAEAQAIDMVLVRRAAGSSDTSSQRWQVYCESQGLPDVVKPLLVLQAPNTPDHDKLGEALNVIFEEMPELGIDSVRHVLGEPRCRRSVHIKSTGSNRKSWRIESTYACSLLGRHLHRMGLPSRRGAGVVSHSERPRPHSTTARTHGPHAARKARAGRR